MSKAKTKRENDPGLLPVRAMDGQRNGITKKSLTTCRRGGGIDPRQRKVVNIRTKLSRRRLLAHVSVIAAAMAPLIAIALGDLPASKAALSAHDPIFAVIAEHKAAVEACIAFDDEAKSEEALDYEDAVFKTLFTTVPTTVAGVTAWLQYLASPEHPDGNSIVATQHYDAEFQSVVTRQLLSVSAVLMKAQS